MLDWIHGAVYFMHWSELSDFNKCVCRLFTGRCGIEPQFITFYEDILTDELGNISKKIWYS